jgi:hypothetical protein
MKSLRDEICLAAEDGGGFSLSEAVRLRFHLRRHTEDFIRAKRGFHRVKHDFIDDIHAFGATNRFSSTPYYTPQKISSLYPLTYRKSYGIINIA